MTVGEENALERLLAAVRFDLRRGDYARLETYSVELEASMAEVAGLPPQVLARVLRAAQGNELCLAAALQGLQAGRRRLGEIGAAMRGEAYDAQGRRHVLDGPDRRLRIGSNAADFDARDQESLNPRRL